MLRGHMAKKARRSAPSRKTARRGRKTAAAPKASTLAGRFRLVVGDATFREVGKATGTHPENARRYLSGGSVGLKFLRSFARAYNVSADWLLEGTGPQNRR